jgi:hypothetical protein
MKTKFSTIFILIIVLSIGLTALERCKQSKFVNQLPHDSSNNVKYSLDSNWSKVKIDSLCSFDFPSNRLEFQNEYFRSIGDTILKFWKVPNLKKMVLQQNGLNDFNNSNYVRVLIEVTSGNEDEFFSRNTMVSLFNNSEKELIYERVRNNIETNLKSVNTKVLKWHIVTLNEINGLFCIEYKYDRISFADPQKSVTVTTYSFYDNNKIIDLTLSSMSENYLNWKSDFDKIVSSFHLY